MSVQTPRGPPLLRLGLGLAGSGLRALPTVSKLVDTSTCIGCKACEVACQEWNDLPTVATSPDGELPDPSGPATRSSGT